MSTLVMAAHAKRIRQIERKLRLEDLDEVQRQYLEVELAKYQKYLSTEIEAWEERARERKERQNVATRSYKIELTTFISVTLNDSVAENGENWQQIIDKAKEIIKDSNFDMNEREYTFKVVGHVKEHD